MEQASASSMLSTSRFVAAALEMNPSWSRTYYHLGRHAFLRQDFETAIDWLQRAKELDPEDVLIAFTLGYAYYEQGYREQGIAELHRSGKIQDYFVRRGWKSGDYDVLYLALAIDPSRSEIYSLLGDLYWTRHLPHKAVEAYRQGVAQQEIPNAATWLAKGRIFEYEGQWDDAIRAYEQAINTWPREGPEVYYSGFEPYGRIASIYRSQLHDADRAIEWLKRQQQLFPNYIWSYLGIGDIYREEGDYEQALRWFNEARVRFPGHAWPFVSIGLMLDEQGRITEATSYLEKAVTLAPNRPWQYYYLAVNLLERGDSEGAILHLQQASRNAPNDTHVHLNVAEIYEELGRCQGAINEYEEVIAIDPDNERAQQRLELLRESPCD